MSRISLILQFLYMLAYKVEGLDSICIYMDTNGLYFNCTRRDK